MSDDSEEETSGSGSSGGGGGGGGGGSPDWPVTEEWLRAVLERHHRRDLGDGGGGGGAIAVVDFQVRPGCETGESVLSDILAVAVKYRLPGEDPGDGLAAGAERSLSFVVKLLPQDPFSRFFVTEAQFDLREIRFYTQVVPDLERFKTERLPADEDFPLPIPKCYYAHYNPGSTSDRDPAPPESVLVLENVKPARYAGVDFSRGLTREQTAAALEAIAKMHALSLAFKVKEAAVVSERYPFLFQTTRASDSYQQLVERGLPQLTEFLEKKAEMGSVLDALNSLRANTKDLIENLLKPEEPMALITHTDFWCNNLMFKETGDKTVCCILDWQMVTYSRPTNDVALLLISSVPANLRREHSEAFLDVYWDTLIESCAKLNLDVEGELGYDRKKLSSDYRRSQLLALLLCIGSVDVALGDPNTEQRLLELLRDLYDEGLLKEDA